jgi:hypothetical protein
MTFACFEDSELHRIEVSKQTHCPPQIDMMSVSWTIRLR